MNRWWRLILLLVPTLLLLRGIYLTRNHFSFETYLNTLYINFDDFPSSYSDALKTSVAENKPLEYNYTSFPTPDSSATIPPTIHFIWFQNLYQVHEGGTQIAKIGSAAPDLCRKYNPDFTINIWNATAARTLMEQNYAWFLPTYDSYTHPIQRVDAFKYFVLWHYGGFYIDLDIACRRPLTPLRPYPAWFPRASPFGVNNDLMASRSQHPVIGKMTETLTPRNKNLLFPWLTIFWTTGPQFTSDVLKMWWNEQPGKRHAEGSSRINSDPDEFFVLPRKFYSEKYTFFGHSPGGTWHGKDVAVVLWIVDRLWMVALISSLSVVACLVLVLRVRKFKRKVYTQLRSSDEG